MLWFGPGKIAYKCTNQSSKYTKGTFQLKSPNWPGEFFLSIDHSRTMSNLVVLYLCLFHSADTEDTICDTKRACWPWESSVIAKAGVTRPCRTERGNQGDEARKILPHHLLEVCLNLPKKTYGHFDSYSLNSRRNFEKRVTTLCAQ